MNLIRDRVVGKMVLSADRGEDYFQIRFDHGGVLNLYAASKIEGGMFSDLVGRICTDLVELNSEAVLHFDGGVKVFVSLRQDAAEDSEFMELTDDGRMFIWRVGD